MNCSLSQQKKLQDIYFDIVTEWRADLRDIDFRTAQLEQNIQSKIFPAKLFGELSTRQRGDGHLQKVGSYTDMLIGLADKCAGIQKGQRPKSKLGQCCVDGEGHMYRKKSHRKPLHDTSTNPVMKNNEDSHLLTAKKKNRRQRLSSSMNSKLRFPKVNQGLRSNLVGVRSPIPPSSPSLKSSTSPPPWMNTSILTPEGEEQNDCKHAELAGDCDMKDQPVVTAAAEGKEGSNQEEDNGVDVFEAADNNPEFKWVMPPAEGTEYGGHSTPTGDKETHQPHSPTAKDRLFSDDCIVKEDSSENVVLKMSSVTTLLMSDEETNPEMENTSISTKT